VLGLLGVLYGREPRPFQTLNFKVGTQQRPHSDQVDFNTEPPGLMCGVWVAMEDIDED
jgi:ectoine hydroxylase-related dioxygenase (phytanoyl-CoA dioxygenase family)